MKKVKLTSFGALAVLAVLTSCDESMYLGDMTGTILPNVTYDATVLGAPGADSRVSESDLTAEDLTLTLTSADGKLSETFTVSTFPTERNFAVGKYTLTASYGDIDDEGFEKPAVYGSAELSVLEGKATQVDLTAVPSKAMVGIKYDESALNYFTELKASLHSAGGKTIEYATDETRYAYLKPGEVTVDVTFTKPNGKGGTLEVAKFTAEAQHRYTLGVALGGSGAGDAGITIQFDETLALDDVTVDISDEVLSVPAPELTLSGVGADNKLQIVAGSPLAEPLRVDIKALGGIKSAVLTTTGTDLNLPAGWPAEIDLATASADQQKTLTDLGFKNIGIFNNPGKLAAFDLSGVVAHLPATAESASPVTFALKVTDKNGKVASEEPLTFSVKVDKLALTLASPEGYAYAGEETVDVLVSYNGTADLRDILTVKYLASTGTMKPTTIADVQPQSRASQTYVVSVVVPGDAQLPITLQATAGDITTDEVEIPQAPAPVVAVNANDVFATSAWAVVSSDSYDVTAKTIEIQIAKGNENFVKATGEQNGAEFHITGGLTPDTEYRLRAKVGALLSNTVTFTTEAAAQIPGSDMNSWNTEQLTAGLFNANKWTKYIPASPWATLNDYTLSKINGACIRSGAESTQSTDDSHAGKAAVVRTVGWDTATTFNDCGQHTAGELYLGSYSNGAANYGIPFTSRPSELKFWCKFSQFKDGESGVAEVEVLDANGKVIASGNLKPNNTDYQQLSINLTYERGAKKAATLRVKFKSNAKEGLNKDDVQSYNGGNTSIRPVGSQFYIDDIELVY